MLNERAKTRSKALLLLLALASLALPSASQEHSTKQAPRQNFAPAADWRPTNAVAGARYVGNAACAQCHTQTETQPATTMGTALETVATSAILRTNPQLEFKSGPFHYSIKREGERSLFTVSDGKQTITVPLQYAFGQGKAGQTYVFEYQGRWYEARVSFYNALDGLDYTIGQPRQPSRNLNEALGRVLDKADVNDCFSCHATAAVRDNKLQLDQMTRGITCEGCHGPGASHVAAMQARSAARRNSDQASAVPNTAILNPGRFDTEGQTQFCGACHRTWAQVQAMSLRGVQTVRFQPYRLFASKCYDFDDARIRCTACHDPHDHLLKQAAHYDAKCQACHQASAQTKRALICKVGKQGCAGCHMPKYEIPGAHFNFTDHQIRVVRAGEKYPE
jgi:hypothetical protein